LNGANKAHIDGVFALPDRATRLLSGIYTRYNPMFPLMNKIRDTQSQLSLIMADAPVSDRLAAVRRAAANNVAFSTQWRNRPGSVYHQWREKYEKLGGATMYSDLFRDEPCATSRANSRRRRVRRPRIERRPQAKRLATSSTM
jgi:hypothetical protein